MAKPVTGPDGDNPLTDEQIRQLESEAGNLTGLEYVRLMSACDEALNNPDARPPRPCPARDRLVAAWNARHAKATP